MRQEGPRLLCRPLTGPSVPPFPGAWEKAASRDCSPFKPLQGRPLCMPRLLEPSFRTVAASWMRLLQLQSDAQQTHVWAGAGELSQSESRGYGGGSHRSRSSPLFLMQALC